MDHEWVNMNKLLAVLVLIASLMGCVAALDVQNGVEMRPGEAAFEHLFNQGIGQPWVGGNPPGFQGDNQGISTGISGDIFFKYSQFFSISKGNGHKTHIEAPTKYEINSSQLLFTSAIKCKRYHIHNIRLIPHTPAAIRFGYRGRQVGPSLLPSLKVLPCHFWRVRPQAATGIFMR
jgi:hypothetical protein